MDRTDHGSKRSGLITASVARTIMSGNAQAWDSLVTKLWDDGTEFAAPSTGARAFGHEQEQYARAKFWERYPHLDIDNPEFVSFQRRGYAKDHPYRMLLACSPDMGVIDSMSRKRTAGGEIKSPTTEGTYQAYAADLARGRLPREHEDQVRFSIFVTGWDWVFIAHFGELYKDLWVSGRGQSEYAQREWQDKFTPRLDAFIKLYLEGKQPKRDKLNVKGLQGLLG